MFIEGITEDADHLNLVSSMFLQSEGLRIIGRFQGVIHDIFTCLQNCRSDLQVYSVGFGHSPDKIRIHQGAIKEEV